MFGSKKSLKTEDKIEKEIEGALPNGIVRQVSRYPFIYLFGAVVAVGAIVILGYYLNSANERIKTDNVAVSSLSAQLLKVRQELLSTQASEEQTKKEASSAQSALTTTQGQLSSTQSSLKSTNAQLNSAKACVSLFSTVSSSIDTYEYDEAMATNYVNQAIAAANAGNYLSSSFDINLANNYISMANSQYNNIKSILNRVARGTC